MTSAQASVLDRAALVGRAKSLNAATIGWNAIEGVVAVLAGAAAGSASLIGFGLDSGIEVSAALILTWRLAQERRDGIGSGATADRRAQRAIALSFAALALYVGVSSIIGVLSGERPEVSLVGIIMASLSLVVMPALAGAKRRVAIELGSRAAEAEAHQTNLCAMLSAAVLAGLGANALLSWWWADGFAALVIAGVAALMAVKTWNADALEETCCG